METLLDGLPFSTNDETLSRRSLFTALEGELSDVDLENSYENAM